MRATQAYICSSVESFKTQFYEKYHLTDWTDKTKPVVMFGLYSDQDYKFYQSYPAEIIVVWCGSDGLWLNDHRAAIVKEKQNVKHYAIGKFLHDDLTKWGIQHEIKPICPTSPDLKCVPRGHKVYSYGTNDWGFYGLNIALNVCDRLHLEWTFASYDRFSREKLMEVYNNSFIGLRLTKHDGLPNTVIELGLMGRRCVYNGSLPNCLPWSKESDIYWTVLTEYRYRGENNKLISEQMKDYINISDTWLNV